MSITILYGVLILSTAAVVGVALAAYLHVRKHMQHPPASETMKHVALREAEERAARES